MDDEYRTEKANNDLLAQRFPDKSFIDDVLSTLSRAEGMVGLIGDAATLAQDPLPSHVISMENLERTIREIEMTIKDAAIIINDYWFEKLENGMHVEFPEDKPK